MVNAVLSFTSHRIYFVKLSTIVRICTLRRLVVGKSTMKSIDTSSFGRERNSRRPRIEVFFPCIDEIQTLQFFIYSCTSCCKTLYMIIFLNRSFVLLVIHRYHSSQNLILGNKSQLYSTSFLLKYYVKYSHLKCFDRLGYTCRLYLCFLNIVSIEIFY